VESAHEQLTLGGIALRLLAVLVLVLANAFFVAAEFALVGARRSRIDAMAAQGDASAKIVQDTLRHLDRYISGTQLGITLASLALGWIGEATLASLIDRLLNAMGVVASPGASHATASVIVAFAVITFLHIVLGELAPKSIALLYPEDTSRWVARPLRWFSRIMHPFVVSLNGAAGAMLRLFNIEPVGEESRVHSPDELRLLVAQTHAHGMLDESDRAMIAGVFDFHDKRARDVMRPRTEVAAIPADATPEEVWRVIRTERYSRYPVYGESLDDIVGVFIAKDLWLHDGSEPFALQRFVRDALFVPDSRPAERVFDDLRKTRAQMAIVLDEYGGTAGIVTIEDLVEEIVGDISDEYDVAAREAMEVGGVLELAGQMSLVDARSDYSLDIPEGSWTTLGGFVFSRLGRLPKVGDRVPYSGGELEVVAMDGRRVAALRVHRSAVGAAPGAGRA
jgi:CBS domain containing-hemolysin-like protein